MAEPFTEVLLLSPYDLKMILDNRVLILHFQWETNHVVDNRFNLANVLEIR